MWQVIAILSSLLTLGDAALAKSEDYCTNLTFTGSMATQGSGSARDSMGNFHYQGRDAAGNSYFKHWQCRERTGEYNPTELYLTYRDSSCNRFPSNWAVVEKPRLTETDDEQDIDINFHWRAAGEVEWPTLVTSSWEHGETCQSYPEDGWRNDCPSTPTSGVKWTSTTGSEASMICMADTYECVKWDRLTYHEAAMITVTVICFAIVFGICLCVYVYEKYSVERDESDAEEPFNFKTCLTSLLSKWVKYWNAPSNMPQFKNTLWLSRDDTRDAADVEAQRTKQSAAVRKQIRNDELVKLEKIKEIERKREKRAIAIFNNPDGFDAAKMKLELTPQVVDESQLSKKEQADLAKANKIMMKSIQKEELVKLEKEKAEAAAKAAAAAETRERETQTRIKRAEAYAAERKKRDELKLQKEESARNEALCVAPAKKKKKKKKKNFVSAETQNEFFSGLVTHPEAEPKPGAAPTPSKKAAKDPNEGHDRTATVLEVPMDVPDIHRISQLMARLPEGDVASSIGMSMPRFESLTRLGESVPRLDFSLAPFSEYNTSEPGPSVRAVDVAESSGGSSRHQQENVSSKLQSGPLGTAI